MEFESVPQMFASVVDANRGGIAFQFKKNGTWQDVTWDEAKTTVDRISRGLMALGVQHGDKVNILAQSRLEWSLCDLGIAGAGAATVGIYPSNLAEDCAYVINHSDAVVMFIEDETQLAKIQSVRHELKNVRKLIVFNGASDAAADVLGWDDFLSLADDVSDVDHETRLEMIQSGDLASIVYTSGTTGVPKGAMLTHDNLLFTSGSVEKSLAIGGDYTTLLFLPLAHVFARMIAYASLRTATTVAFAEDITTVAANLKEIRPHFIASVPRIFEKVHDKITTGVREAGGIKEKLFNWALGVGRRVSRHQQAGRPIPGLLGLQHSLAEKLVLGKVQAALGGRLHWAVSGAAPLNQEIAEFFHACGVLILEGIGMTENTSFSNVNRFNNNRFGTVGEAGPGIEQKIAPDGEVLYRGRNVMQGYYKNPEATAETIDEEGWLYTGDVGEIDDDGFLRITDRKKDLIITAGGKNVAPQRIERILRASSYISQVVAIGDKRKFISALITLEPENMAKWAQKNGMETATMAELANDPKVFKLIEDEVAIQNAQLASFESVKKFVILEQDFTIESGDMTPSLKVKRKTVLEKFADRVEQMYA